MQNVSTVRRSLTLVLVLAIFTVAGLQIAHWDSERSFGSVAVKVTQNSDGLCPICYSVPVGHGAAPTVFVPVRLEGQLRIRAILAESAGIQPEFHLHIRPPPSAA
jgi:hypothetical protein